MTTSSDSVAESLASTLACSAAARLLRMLEIAGLVMSTRGVGGNASAAVRTECLWCRVLVLADVKGVIKLRMCKVKKEAI